MFLLPFRKYRDKSTELGLGASSNQDVDAGSSPSISPSQISPPINAYYAKHFDQSGSAKNTTNSSSSNSGGTYQTITSKFKSKISLGKETQTTATAGSSLSNPISSTDPANSSSPPQHLNSVAGSLFKRSKLKKLSSLGTDIKQGFDFDLPRSRLNSVHSVNDNLNSTSSSTSSSSGSNSSTGSQSNNQPIFLESGSSMIMTSPSNQPEAVVAATHLPPATSSPIVMQQPQFVNNTLNSNSSAGAMSITSSNPNSPSVFLNNSSSSSTSSPSDKPNGSTLNNNNNLSINNSSTTSTPSSPTSPSSYSYLDDANLKIAIIDYQDLLKLIKQQSMIDYNEWIAFNTKMFFDQINVLYGAIADYCTPQSCPTMNGPSNQQFHWLDEKGKKCKYSAPQYIDTVLTYSAKIVDDENLFPTKVGHPFPANFDQLVKRIHKHLFQVMAHMYHSHYKELLHLQLNTNCNTIYFHMYLFAKTFNLIDDKELDILDKLNAGLVAKYLSANGGDPLFIQSTSNSGSGGASNTKESSSSSSGGFSFFKKKLNFNLIP